MKAIARVLFLFILMGAAGTVQTKAQTVYVTESGKKYHAKNCEVVKTGKKGITLEEAKKQGFEPCKVCKADAIKPEKKKSEPAKGKKKQG